MSAVNNALSALDDFERELSSYFTVLASALSGSRSSVRLSQVGRQTASVIETGERVESALKQVEEHQTAQRAIADLQSKLDEQRAKIKQLGVTLNDCERALEQEISRAKTLEGDSNKISSQAQVKTEWIFDLSKKLSYITKAPPGWNFKQGRGLPGKFHPPAPQVDDMKKSLLFKSPKEVTSELSKLADSIQQNAEKLTKETKATNKSPNQGKKTANEEPAPKSEPERKVQEAGNDDVKAEAEKQPEDGGRRKRVKRS